MSAPLPILRERGRRGVQTSQQRAELKRQLALGKVHLVELLEDPPECALGMKLENVLLALPLVHRRKTEMALIAADASGWTTIRGLTDRQRELLLQHFKQRWPSIWTTWNVMARRNGQ